MWWKYPSPYLVVPEGRHELLFFSTPVPDPDPDLDLRPIDRLASRPQQGSSEDQHLKPETSLGWRRGSTCPRCPGYAASRLFFHSPPSPLADIPKGMKVRTERQPPPVGQDQVVVLLVGRGGPSSFSRSSAWDPHTECMRSGEQAGRRTREQGHRPHVCKSPFFSSSPGRCSDLPVQKMECLGQKSMMGGSAVQGTDLHYSAVNCYYDTVPGGNKQALEHLCRILIKVRASEGLDPGRKTSPYWHRWWTWPGHGRDNPG